MNDRGGAIIKVHATDDSIEAVEKAHVVYEWPEKSGHGVPRGRKRGKVR